MVRTTEPPDAGGGERSPGQRAGLSGAEVLARAHEIAEREGLERLSMRRLAGELGVAPNALYTYFRDKEALLDALFDRLLGEIEVPDPERGDWREGLAELMRASRRLLLAHPRLVGLFLARPGGPNAMRLGEATLRLLARGGVRERRAVQALRALLTYTLGFAALEVPRRGAGREERLERAAGLIAGLPEAEFRETRGHARELATHPGDRDFEAGLEWLLRGIAGE